FPITPPALGPTSALSLFVSLLILPPPISTLFPYTTLFRSDHLLNGQRAECARLVLDQEAVAGHLPKLLADDADRDVGRTAGAERDRKSTRLNSSHGSISYAVFCLKKKKKKTEDDKSKNNAH